MTTVEVQITTDPAGRPAVLVQLEHGWITLLPEDAVEVAGMILDAADAILSGSHNPARYRDGWDTSDTRG